MSLIILYHIYNSLIGKPRKEGDYNFGFRRILWRMREAEFFGFSHISPCSGEWRVWDQLLLVSLSVSLPSSHWSAVTLLASDWSRQITWPACWPLIGWHWHWTCLRDPGQSSQSRTLEVRPRQFRSGPEWHFIAGATCWGFREQWGTLIPSSQTRKK